MTNFEKWKKELKVDDLFILFLNGKNNDISENKLSCIVCPARIGWAACASTCDEQFKIWAESEAE